MKEVKSKQEITVFSGDENLGAIHAFEYESMSEKKPLRVYFGSGQEAKLLGTLSPQDYDLLSNGKFEGVLCVHKNLPSHIQIIPAKSQKSRIIGVLMAAGIATTRDIKAGYTVLEAKDAMKPGREYLVKPGDTSIRAIIATAANMYGVHIPYTTVSGLLKTLSNHKELSGSFKFMKNSFQEELVDAVFEPKMVWAINRGVSFTEHQAAKWKKINSGDSMSRQDRIAYAVAFFYAEICAYTGDNHTDYAKKVSRNLDSLLANHSNLNKFFEYINTTLS